MQDHVSPAIQQLGNSGAAFAGALIDRQRRRDEFDDQQLYRQFTAERTSEYVQAQQQMPEGGAGFTEGLMGRFDAANSPFMASLSSDEQRERFGAILDVDRINAGTRAAQGEHSEVVRYQTDVVTDQAEEAALGLVNNPDGFEAAMAEVEASLANSNLSPAARATLHDGISQTMSRVYLDAISNDPLRVIRETGGDLQALPVEQRVTAMMQVLMGSGVAGSGLSSPDENSPRVGAFGMTVSDLNRLGAIDGVEPQDAAKWGRMLSNPDVAVFFAQRRLEEIMAGGVDNIDDAYAAFYMGDDFIEGGWAYGDLPRSVGAAVREMTGQLSAPGTRPADVQLHGYDAGTSRVTPEIGRLLQTALAQMGVNEIHIGDQERAQNAGYGATHSHHILYNRDEAGNETTPTGRTGAFDLGVSSWTQAARVELAERLSALGIQGIGIYMDGSMHIDLRSSGRTAWGSDFGTIGSAPAWARDVLTRHVNGQITSVGPGARVNPRLHAAGASTILNAQQAAFSAVGATSTPTGDMRQIGQTFVSDYISSIENGVEPPEGDIEAAINIQTPSVQATAREDIFVAEAVADALADIDERSEAELEAMMTQLRDPEVDGFNTAVGQRIIEEVEEGINETRAERRRDPVGVAFADPGVQQAWNIASQVNPLTGLPRPGPIQDFIAQVTTIQRERFNLTPGEIQHLPRRELATLATQIGAFTRNPDTNATERAEASASFALVMVETYGEYATEVMADALTFLRFAGADGSPEAALISMIANEERNLSRDEGDLRLGGSSTDAPNEAGGGGAAITPNGLEAIAADAAAVEDSVEALAEYDRLRNTNPQEAAAYLRGLSQEHRNFIASNAASGVGN